MSQVSMGRVAGASFIGALIEWYDFFLYGTAAAIVFNQLFFPNFDPLVGTIVAFATFGAGFVARPIGALVFGHYGDRIGRKAILVITLVMMGGSTFLIGLLPTYHTIGIWAPILLVSLRLFQGFGIGGEYGGAALLTIEHAPRNRRGFWGGFIQGATSAGLLLAMSVFSLISLLPEEQFLSWGWRIPFLISIFLLAIGAFIRIKIKETPAFEKVKSTNSIVKYPAIEMLRAYPKNFLLTFGARVGETVSANITNAFAIAYITTQLGLPRKVALTGILIASVIAIITSPLLGALSDRIGRRPIYMGSAIFLAVFSFPFFYLLNTKEISFIWLAIVFGYVFASTAMLSVQSVYYTEMFGTRVRYSALSLVYQLSSIIGGFTPLFATYLLKVNQGSPWYVAAYTSAAAVITVYAVYKSKETYKQDESEREEHEQVVVNKEPFSIEVTG